MTSGMPTKTVEVFKAVAYFAKNGKTPTYKEVGDVVKLHWRQVPTRLYSIWQWCENRQPPLPHLNAIVVNGKTKRPGVGYMPHSHQLSEMEFQKTKRQVFACKWDTVRFP